MDKEEALLRLEIEKCKKHLKQLLEAQEVYRREIEKRAREIAESRELLVKILDALDMGILVLDREMNVIHINKFLRDLFSIETDNVKGKCWEVLMKKNVPCNSDKCFNVIRGGEKTEEEIVLFVDGKKRIFWIKTEPLKIGDNIFGIIRTFIDITDKKLEEEYNVLSGISMHISHVMKNSIVPVASFLKRISSACQSEEKLINMMISSIDSLLRTLKGYEDFVKVKSKKKAIFKEINLKAFLTKFLDYVFSEDFLRKYNLLFYKDKYSISFDIDSIGDVYILGSIDVLNIGFCNLLSTLIEVGYTFAKRNVNLDFSVHRREGFVRIVFEGDFKIPSGLISLIYEPWVVVEGKNFDRWGFAIAREVALLHNGNFEVLSGERGIASTMDLPIYRE